MIADNVIAFCRKQLFFLETLTKQWRVPVVFLGSQGGELKLRTQWTCFVGWMLKQPKNQSVSDYWPVATKHPFAGGPFFAKLVRSWCICNLPELE